MKDLALQYLNILLGMFQYDIQMFTSHKWMIYTVVPGAVYLVFFFLKWVVLTTPLWMPLAIIFGARGGGHRCGCGK